jgi:hypothetical protein
VKARQQISCDKETTICRSDDAVLRDRNTRNPSTRCEYRAMNHPGADSIHRAWTLEDFRDREAVGIHEHNAIPSRIEVEIHWRGL